MERLPNLGAVFVGISVEFLCEILCPLWFKFVTFA